MRQTLFTTVGHFTNSENLCKLGKEYLNTLTCNFYTFFSYKILKLLAYHMPFSH